MGRQVIGGEGANLQTQIPGHQDLRLQNQEALRQEEDQEEGDQDWQGTKAGIPDGHRSTGGGTVFRRLISFGEGIEDNLAGQDLYDYLFEYGKEFNVKAGCPNLIERIESALLSYGNDFDNRDNPFEANFDKFVNLDSEVNFLGKEKLKKLKQDGIKRKLMGVMIDHNKIDMYCEKTLLDNDNKVVGYVRSATYSPTFKKVIGIAMINKPYWDNKTQFKIDINDKIFVGTVCDLPFI